MQAARQISTEIGQDSLTARNDTGERRESEPTQTATGPASLNSTTSPSSALSAAERSARDLEGPQNTAGPAWEEHWRIFGYKPSSRASRSRPGSGNSRGRGRRQPAAFSPYFHRKNTWTRAFVCLAFSKQNALPSTSERITLTLNGLTSVIDCGTPSKPPPKCTKCCSICCKRKLTKSSVSSLALNCNLLDIDQVGNFKVERKNLSDQSHPPYFQKRGAESSFPGFFPTRRLRTVVFLRFKNDRSSYTVKFRK